MMKRIKWNHYLNYIVIGLLTAVLGGIALAGGHFDSSLLYLLEKMSISIITCYNKPLSLIYPLQKIKQLLIGPFLSVIIIRQ